jgi:hypothetical protein
MPCWNSLPFMYATNVLKGHCVYASEEILLHIARNCGFNDKINTENYQDLILELNTKILGSSSLEVKHRASHSFLTNLIEHNISLFPRISNYLDKLSKITVVGQ